MEVVSWCGTHVVHPIKLHSSSLAVISVLLGMETVQGQYCAPCAYPATGANIKATRRDNSLLWAPVSTTIVFAQNFLIMVWDVLCYAQSILVPTSMHTLHEGS